MVRGFVPAFIRLGWLELGLGLAISALFPLPYMVPQFGQLVRQGQGLGTFCFRHFYTLSFFEIPRDYRDFKLIFINTGTGIGYCKKCDV